MEGELDVTVLLSVGVEGEEALVCWPFIDAEADMLMDCGKATRPSPDLTGRVFRGGTLGTLVALSFPLLVDVDPIPFTSGVCLDSEPLVDDFRPSKVKMLLLLLAVFAFTLTLGLKDFDGEGATAMLETLSIDSPFPLLATALAN